MANGAESQSIEYELTQAGLVVDNSGLPDIAVLMEPRGYNQKERDRARMIYAHAKESVLKRKWELGEQVGATADLVRVQTEMNDLYMEHLKFIRIELECENMAATSLDLTGRRKKTFHGWSGQFSQFYGNLLRNPNWISRAASIGISEKELKDNLNRLSEVTALFEKQQAEIGDAQRATRDQDLALEDLFDWTSRYIKVARVALAKYPELIEKLGITYPS